LIEKVIEVTDNVDKSLSLALAMSFEKDKSYIKAHMFFCKAQDPIKACSTLDQIMEMGNQGERDLFIARLCFNFLARDQF
jgi:hypothetical protein